MPAFDSDHLYDEGAHFRSIRKAREDLESDYGCHVFIWSNDINPGLGVESASPPHGKQEAVQGRFEIKAQAPFVRTYGYRYIVFSEGKFRYTHDKGAGWITYSGTAVVNGDSYAFESKTANWMGRLKDSIATDLPLSALTIPGTHNTVAQVGKAGSTPFVTAMAECQGYNLVEQLLMGVRSFDFRFGENFELRHGRAYLFAGRLHGALDAINNYLNAHPGEIVLVGAKWDHEEVTGYRRPEPPNLRQDIENIFFSHSNALDIKEPPTLNNTRGKMLLFADGDSSRGIRCGGPGFQPDIPGNLDEKGKKWAEVEQNLKFNLSHKEVVNHEWYHVAMNAYYMTGPFNMITPNDFAQHINPLVSKWVTENCPGGSRSRLGRVEMDFAAPDIVRGLVQTNFS